MEVSRVNSIDMDGERNRTSRQGVVGKRTVSMILIIVTMNLGLTRPALLFSGHQGDGVHKAR